MGTTKPKFHKLTPIRDIELNVYADSLDFVFRDPDLRNIAITGSYCSGKSSMLESYKSAHNNMRFVHISLAHFETVTDTNVDSDEKQAKADIKVVEGKILNQFIHQIDVKKIPQTHFKVKRSFPRLKMGVSTFVTTVFLTIIVFLLNRNAWITLLSEIPESKTLKKILGITTTEYFVFVLLGICCLIGFYGIYSFLKLQHNKNFLRKLSIQGNEIELFENDNESFFDKHLNEVLYLFHQIEADAVVFEDMDRYNSNQIFEKLREINYLLNNSPNASKGKIFRFFYLLRDDIFTAKDRTKFFDFIIPIVPVIDGANSYDKLIEYFSDGGILSSFDQDFLQEISMYIDDMRLLKNIYNEYRFYYDRIQLTELNSNKLLGLITYKNLFPRDFSELQLGKGYVYCLFRNKEQFTRSELADINKQIKEVYDGLKNNEQEQTQDIDELDSIFLPTGYGLKEEKNPTRAETFDTRRDLIKALKNNPERGFYYTTNFSRQDIDIQSVFNELASIPEYVERRERIEAMSSGKQQLLSEKLRQLNIRKKELESATLSEIVQTSKEMASFVFASSYTDEISVVHEYPEIKGSIYFPLIKYLIRNKHIDENYQDYMSYFYEQSISKGDQIFLRSIYDAESKPFDYPLKNPALVNKKISQRYYSQPEILNYDFFAFLLESSNENLSLFLEQLKNNKKIDFIVGFWKIDKEKHLMVSIVNKAWPELWLIISQEASLTAKDAVRYLIDSFNYSSLDEIGRMNFDNALTKYISQCEDFLCFGEPKAPFVEALTFLKIRFSKINYDGSNKELFDEIYSRNLYMINQSMVFLILEKIYKLAENEDFIHANYSLLMKKPDERIVSYIGANMDTYIRLVCDICKEKITDDEVNVLAILNHSEVSAKSKEKYIGVLLTKIQKIDEVKEAALWPLLLVRHLIPCTPQNILAYYFRRKKAFDSDLTQFINTSDLTHGLSYQTIVRDYGEKNASAFYENLLKNNDLNNDKYSLLFKEFGRVYTNFLFEGIDTDKVEILIKLRTIQMNINNLSFIRQKYAPCKMQFILTNINDYTKKVITENRDAFDLNELNELLKKRVSDDNLLQLLSFTKEQISVANVRISNRVRTHIIKNNYCRSDLPLIVSGYDNETPELKLVIFSLCVEEFGNNITDDIKIPYDLLSQLLESPDISSKIELLATQLVNLTQEQAMECLEILEMNELLKVFEGKWPSIINENGIIQLLRVMKSRKWISSYSKDKSKAGNYRVRGRRSFKSKEDL